MEIGRSATTHDTITWITLLIGYPLKPRALYQQPYQRTCLWHLVSVFLLSHSVFSATYAAELPGNVQPGQIEKQLQAPKVTPSIPAPVIQDNVPNTNAPEGAKEISLELNEIVIQGSTVYSPESFAELTTPLLHQTIHLDQVYALADKLTARYRNDGYILSKVIVPPQSVAQGTIVLQAVEGYIAHIAYTNNTVASERVDHLLQSLTQMKPLNSHVLEKTMLLINDMPGLYAQGALRPDPSVPQAAEFVVQLRETKVQAGLSVDNRGGRALGPYRVYGDVKVNQLVGTSDYLAARLATTLSDELNYLSLGYGYELNERGLKLDMALAAAEAYPGDITSFPLHVHTQSRSAYVMLSYPVIRSRTENLQLRGSLAAINASSHLLGIKNSDDQLRALRLGATYDLADRYAGINVFDIEFSQGLKAFGASNNDSQYLSRADGRVDYSKLDVSASRLQVLSHKWLLLLAANAQYAFTSLLSPELFGFGGEQFGRGYDPSELVGDHGIAAKAELRYSDKLSWLGNRLYTAYGFYDIGKVYQRQSNVGEDISAASAGTGLKLRVSADSLAFIELAKPLTKDVFAEHDRDWRVYAGFSLRY